MDVGGGAGSSRANLNRITNSFKGKEDQTELGQKTALYLFLVDSMKTLETTRLLANPSRYGRI